MPPILKRLVSQLQANGLPKSRAYPIAVSGLQRVGDLKSGSTKLTHRGLTRQKMGASGRAKDRAAKASGHKSGEYKYSAKTNRATLK